MRRLFGATLLVAGTSIGAGMLAIPVVTALGGFVPSVILFIVTWAFMCCTGLLFLELALWLGEGKNIVSMAGLTLGNWGRGVAWFLYIYLFYSLTIAYVAGSGGVISTLIGLPPWFCTFLFVAIFAPLVYFGASAIGRTNILLMVGLAITYILFITFTSPHLRSEYILNSDWLFAYPALPVLVTSFGFQGLIPSLTSYLRRNVRILRIAIILGSFLPLFVYLLWNLIILGALPADVLASAPIAVEPLSILLKSSLITTLGNGFAFFALTSSFLGVTLGLRDFLADGFDIRKDAQGRLFLCAIIFIPALAFAWFDPRLFIFFVNYGGGIGCTLLLGLLPILMIWSGRYRLGLEGPYRVPGGRPLLIALAVFVLVVLLAEVV